MRFPNIQDFRKFANELREPSSYFPIVTELKGITNIALGAIELSASQYMKYSSKPHLNQLAPRHIDRGTAAIKLGFEQAAPGLIVAITAMYVFKKIQPYLANRG